MSKMIVAKKTMRKRIKTMRKRTIRKPRTISRELQVIYIEEVRYHVSSAFSSYIQIGNILTDNFRKDEVTELTLVGVNVQCIGAIPETSMYSHYGKVEVMIGKEDGTHETIGTSGFGANSCYFTTYRTLKSDVQDVDVFVHLPNKTIYTLITPVTFITTFKLNLIKEAK